MAKSFSADKSFVDYITMMGFEYKETHSDKKYYVNEIGNQIRIDYEAGIIALLDNNGNLVDQSETFTNEQIDKFSVKED